MAKQLLRQDINKLDIYHELKAIRYLQSVMMNYLLGLTDYVERIEKLVQRERKREEKEARKKEKANPGKLDFQFFSLRKSYYEALTREYGADTVNDSCVVLDSLMMRSGKGYKEPQKKLREICEMFSIKNDLVNNLSASSQLIRSVNYEMIEDPKEALKYMKATPFYMRNIDKGFLYLEKKFPEERSKLCT